MCAGTRERRKARAKTRACKNARVFRARGFVALAVLRARVFALARFWVRSFFARARFLRVRFSARERMCARIFLRADLEVVDVPPARARYSCGIFSAVSTSRRCAPALSRDVERVRNESLLFVFDSAIRILIQKNTLGTPRILNSNPLRRPTKTFVS